MATMVDRMLEIAEELVQHNPRSSAAKRRAVSTAYYAAFHELALTCADALIADVPVDDLRYERIYRALEHSAIKRAFDGEKKPLNQTHRLRRIGEIMVPLRSERFRADYLPPKPDVFSHERCELLIAQARSAIEELRALSDEDGRSLASHLLFKDVPQ